MNSVVAAFKTIPEKDPSTIIPKIKATPQRIPVYAPHEQKHWIGQNYSAIVDVAASVAMTNLVQWFCETTKGLFLLSGLAWLT